MNKNFLEHLIDRIDQFDSETIKRSLRRLVNEKSFMETISNAIKEGIIVIDVQKMIHYYNPMAVELLGLTNNAVGQKITRYLKNVEWNALAGPSNNWYSLTRQETEVFYPQYRILNFYIVPHSIGSESESEFAVIILNDITADRKREQSSIENYRSEAISMLAASVAHEIGNPLNNINIHLKLAERLYQRQQKTTPDSDSVLEALEIAQEELSRLDTIINNFLRAIRPSKLEMKPLRIADPIETSLNSIKHEISQKNVNVELNISNDMPLIFGDAGQLSQLFYNVIKNALKAMPENGELKIICLHDDQRIQLNFQDSGSGITEHQITKIMDPYFTTSDTGNGLGLLVVERIVREHGGSINVFSRPGEGSIFQINLPLLEQNNKSIEFDDSGEIIDEL